MTTARARLFGAGQPATGVPADLHVGGDSLTVTLGDARYMTSNSALRLREVGTGDASGIELAWDSVDGPIAVHVFEPESRRTLEAALAALPQMQALRRQARRTGIGRSVGWLAIGVFIALPVLLLVLFVWQSDAIARGLTKRISIEQELQLGERMFEGIRGQLKLTSTGPRHDAVALVGGRLTKGSKYRYRFHVAEDDTINAFAVPGGIIVVHTGLIAATRSAEELAGVLAHEVQHIEQRHSLTGIIKQLGLSGLWLLIGGDATGILGSAAFELHLAQVLARCGSAGRRSWIRRARRGWDRSEGHAAILHRDARTPRKSFRRRSCPHIRIALSAKRCCVIVLGNWATGHSEPLPFEQWPPG